MDNLHVFSDYGLLALFRSERREKPFQKLVFLIRDWSSPSEFAYGRSGGDAKLTQYLIQKMTDKNKRVRLYISKSFEETVGFLMPYPGKNVATNPEFEGNVADMDPEFAQHLEEFVTLMLTP